jgi:hypothetical protein
MGDKVLIIKAAMIIEQEAKLLRQSCQIREDGRLRDWACHDCHGRCESRRSYDTMRYVARELRQLAKRAA